MRVPKMDESAWELIWRPNESESLNPDSGLCAAPYSSDPRPIWRKGEERDGADWVKAVRAGGILIFHPLVWEV